MKEQKTAQNGFTLIEMLVVLAIIVLLASLVLPAVNNALRSGRQTKCMSQLRQFGIAWNTNYMEVQSSRYGDEMDAVYPWLSSMVPGGPDDYPDLIGDPSLLICPSDGSEGLDGSKPDDSSYPAITNDSNQFPETDDLDNNPRVDACSYMYEFCDADFNHSWISNIYANSGGETLNLDNADIDGDGRVTWGEVKLHQLDYGDTSSASDNHAYDRSKFPLVRCFHHYRDRRIIVRNFDDNINEPSYRVLNVAVEGNVFLSGLQWEYPVVP